MTTLEKEARRVWYLALILTGTLVAVVVAFVLGTIVIFVAWSLLVDVILTKHFLVTVLGFLCFAVILVGIGEAMSDSNKK